MTAQVLGKMPQKAALMMVALSMGGVLWACSSDDPDSEPEQVDEEEIAEQQEEEEEREQISEAFGLPVPPDHYNIRWQDGRIEVTTKKSLQELRQFFEARLVDYEVVDEGWRLELVPLRSGSPAAEARYAARPERSPVRVEYRPDARAFAFDDGLQSEGEDEVGEAEELAREERPRPTDPEWMEEHRGQPVEVRTDDGELLAPGARWGEPYTPPEGSPLHSERNRANFGRPFGDWSAY